MENFFERIRDIENAEIIKNIKNGDPYVICDLLEQTRGGRYLHDLENAIINTNDIVQIYEFLFLAVDMNISEFNRERFEKKIIESKNPKLMCYCMGFVKGTNIERMIEEVIKTHNTKYLSMILNDKEYADVLDEVKKIYPNYESIVEYSKKFDFYPSSLMGFIQYKDDIEELKKQIKSTKNPHLITELANYIEYLNEYKEGNFDISDLTQMQEELGDPMQCYEFLASVKVEEKTQLIKSVINSGRTKFMYYILEYVPELAQEEKNLLEGNIVSTDPNGKYAKRIVDSKKDKEEI